MSTVATVIPTVVVIAVCNTRHPDCDRAAYAFWEGKIYDRPHREWIQWIVNLRGPVEVIEHKCLNCQHFEQALNQLAA